MTQLQTYSVNTFEQHEPCLYTPWRLQLDTSGGDEASRLWIAQDAEASFQSLRPFTPLRSIVMQSICSWALQRILESIWESLSRIIAPKRTAREIANRSDSIGHDCCLLLWLLIRCINWSYRHTYDGTISLFRAAWPQRERISNDDRARRWWRSWLGKSQRCHRYIDA